MPYNVPTIDGQPVFGLILESTATPLPPAQQISSVFGQSGRLRVFGGTMGFTFSVRGVFQENDIATIQNDFGAIIAFQGPGLHTYIDPRGNTFQNVFIDGEIQPDPKGPHITDIGWCQEYTLRMESLL